MRFRIFLPAMCAALLSTHGTAQTVLLGNKNVESHADINGSGQAQAFQFAASTTGTAATITFYLDSPNTATTAILGVYTDSSGKPQTLLGQGSTTTLTKGAWNTLTVPAFSLTAGVKYWIAILGTGGTIAFRNDIATATSWGSAPGLTALPATWSGSSTAWNNTNVSAYVSGSTAGSSAASLSPSSLAFGNVVVGATSSPQAVTLTNTGGAPLAINSISIGGANPSDFGQNNACGSSLAVGAHCTINVTFTPAATGTRSASLSVSDNAANTPQSVALGGTATATSSRFIPQFSQSVIDQAVSYATLRFDDTAVLSKQGYPYGSADIAANYLAFVAYFYPTATATNGTKVADRLAQDIHSALTTSPGPLLRGIQYAWYDNNLGSILALAKYTPAVWNQLTADDQNRSDWMMKAGALVGSIQLNSANQDYMDTEFLQNGGYLPNQQNGMLAFMSYAYAYFGSASAVNQILTSFDWNTYINQFTAFGWTNLVHTLTVNPQTRAMFESGGSAAYATVQSQGVRIPFTFQGRIITNHACCDTYAAGKSVLPYDPFELFYREEYEYDAASNIINQSCAASSCGYGYLISGSMPNLGQIGMFTEYNVYADRSSPEYSGWAARTGTFHLATLCALGFWNKGDTRHDAAMNRFNLAMNSMIYSDSVGWFDNTVGCKVNTAITDFKGKPFWMDIWNAMLSSYPNWTYHPLS